MGKLIIVSAPSGAGKSTLINHLLSTGYDFSFSISATSRPPRGNERNGVEYFFLSPDDFKQKIKNQEFIEYEEVYPNCFYGTLKSEVDKALDKGRTILFDVDVKGGINIKNIYKDAELQEDRTYKDFLLVRQEGKRSVQRNIAHLQNRN